MVNNYFSKKKVVYLFGKVKSFFMDVTTLLTTLLTTLASGGGVASFMQYKQNKKAKELANDKAASEQWRALYEEQMRTAQALREKLHDACTLLEEEKRRTLLCRFYVCEKLDCMDREPPHTELIPEK